MNLSMELFCPMQTKATSLYESIEKGGGSFGEPMESVN